MYLSAQWAVYMPCIADYTSIYDTLICCQTQMSNEKIDLLSENIVITRGYHMNMGGVEVFCISCRG